MFLVSFLHSAVMANCLALPFGLSVFPSWLWSHLVFPCTHLYWLCTSTSAHQYFVSALVMEVAETEKTAVVSVVAVNTVSGTQMDLG